MRRVFLRQLVVYGLQIGFCLMLVLARGEQTKDTLMRGVGMRFAIGACSALFFRLMLAEY